MILTKKWCKIEHFAEPKSKQDTGNYMDINDMELNYAFATYSDEEIFTLTISEIAEEHLKDKSLQQQIMLSKLVDQLIESQLCYAKKVNVLYQKHFNIKQ